MPRTDLSASERIIVDDLATSTDMIFKIMVPLMENEVACQSNEGVFKYEECPISFEAHREVSTHERQAYAAVRNEERRGLTDTANISNSKIWKLTN